MRIIRGVGREVGALTYDVLSRLMPHDDERLTSDAKDVWDHKLSIPASVKEGSHWRGHGNWHGDHWRDYGQLHLGMIRDGLQMSGRTSPVSTLVDWGSGGGANPSAICPTVDRYFGVDISLSNLDECVRQTKAEGLDNFVPILIPANRPEDAVKLVKEAGGASVDCFLSTAVYQHLPGRKYARRVTETAMRLLANDGFAVINIRYWDLARQNRNWRRSYVDHAHTFNKYTVYEFEKEMTQAGLEIMEIRMRPHSHHAYFFLRKRKN